MTLMPFVKSVGAVTAFAAIVLAGMSIKSSRVHADEGNNDDVAKRMDGDVVYEGYTEVHRKIRGDRMSEAEFSSWNRRSDRAGRPGSLAPRC